MESTVPAPSALRSPDFLLFQGGRLLTILCSEMTAVAIGARVYELTGNTLDLGLVGLAQFLPFLLLATVGGQVADRVDRRLVLMCTYVSFAGCALLLGLLSQRASNGRGGTDAFSLHAIYAVLALLGATRAFSGPAGNALIPHLVPREELKTAVAYSSISFQFATVLGPAAGGILYKETHSASTVFFAAAVLLAVSFVLVAFMKVRTGAVEKKAFTLRTVAAGFRFVWSSKLLLGCISLDLFAVLLGGATALLPVYARDILKVGLDGLGYLRTAPAVGAALMALLLARWPLRRHAGPRLLWAVLLFGMATVVFGISRNYVFSLVMLFVLGAADMISVVVRSTVEQLATPHAMRGRVGAVNQMFIGASNELGAFESGVAAHLLGTVPSVVAGGLGTCLVVGLWTLLFPRLRNVDRLDDVQQQLEAA